MQEQFGYAYDAAGNLNWRTNNALIQQFNVNNLNELTTTTNGRSLTVAGTTTSAATDVTVNSLTATLYGDFSFAREGFTITSGNNTFTAIAQDSYGRWATNTVTVNLPATNNYTYDLNGNLLYEGVSPRKMTFWFCRRAISVCNFPLRWRVSSCRLRKERPAVMPSRPSFAPKSKVSLPVASSAPSRVRDETLFNWSVPPPCRAGRRHRQNN